MPARRAKSINQCVVCQTGSGNFRPRALRKTPGSGLSACLGPGSASVISAYQKNSCSNTGILRRPSTYTEAKRATSQLRESRAMPAIVPITVASAMPMIDTFSVFSRPTSSTRA